MAHDLAQLARLHLAHVDTQNQFCARALAAHGFDALVIHSGTPVSKCLVDDQYWPLRPTPLWLQFAPLFEAGCALVLAPGKKPRMLRARELNVWEAPPPPESDHFWAAFDVTEIGPEHLKSELPQGRVAFVGDDLAAASKWGIPAVNPPELMKALDQLRVHKTAYEEACLLEANLRAAEGHDTLRALFAQADLSELELHLEFLKATAQDDADTPYKNIVALGVHAATLHHVAYEKRARPAQSMLLDAGATCCGYASDITRTWVKGGGAAASTFSQLVNGMERLQQRMCALAKPGLEYEDLHDESHRGVGALLREAGVSKLSADELVQSGITRVFFPHGLGHSLGLQVHDVGCGLRKPKANNPYLRNTTTISERQCFSIEPGLYFIEGLLAPLRGSPYASELDWTLIEQLKAFGGIRIEDDVIVGPQGVRNLTREILPQGGGPAVIV